MRWSYLCGLSLVIILFSMADAQDAARWHRFRGPQNHGLALHGQTVPTEIGVDRNLLWQTKVPSGHASPCIWDDRIYLAAFDQAAEQLELICLDRVDGRVLWRQPVSAEQIEGVHGQSSPASATPVTDGEKLYSYFGSIGLLCHDLDGHELWRVPLPLPQTRNGSGTSPVVSDGRVLLNREGADGNYLLAVDCESGAVAWKHEHGKGRAFGGEATPVVHGKHVIVHRPDAVACFQVSDGEPVWNMNISTTGCSSPLVVDDTVYVAAWNNFGEADQLVTPPPFREVLKGNDKNGNGKLSKDELPKDLAITQRPDVSQAGGNIPFRFVFQFVDQNSDGEVTAFEWGVAKFGMKAFAVQMQHGVVAIQLGGTGDVTRGDRVKWREKRNVPEVPSLLVHQGLVYGIRNGGILSCLDAADGKLHYRKRIGAGGTYYASPIAFDGGILFASGDGVVTIVRPGTDFEVVTRNELNEPIYATPAIVDSTLYVRTPSQLYAFKQMN